LSREQVVEAALRLARTERLENVSMRTLAQELGVPVMTLYNYVTNKDGLDELVVNHLLRSVEIPSPEAGSWEERLRQLERDARRAMKDYPGISFDPRGGRATEAVRLIEGVMSILDSAGFDESGAAFAFATLFTFMLGQIEVDALHAAEDALEHVTKSAQLSQDDLFEFGFQAVIEGLKVLLPSRRPPQGASSSKPAS